MKITSIGSPSSSAQFKKARNAYRPFELIDLLKETEDEFFFEEDAYYIRRYKRKKDGNHELYYAIKKDQRSANKDYRNSLLTKLNFSNSHFYSP